jgi:hypothetical protein
MDLLKLLPVNYHLAPSSSSGRFHSKGETLGQHTDKVLDRTDTIARKLGVSGLELEKLLTAAMLHDMAKYSDSPKRDNLAMFKAGKHTRSDHAERAFRILGRFDMDIAKMVRVHMQQWGYETPRRIWSRKGKPALKWANKLESIWLDLMHNRCKDRAYQLGLIIAYADYAVSRRHDEVTPKEKAHLRGMADALEGYFGKPAVEPEARDPEEQPDKPQPRGGFCSNVHPYAYTTINGWNIKKDGSRRVWKNCIASGEALSDMVIEVLDPDKGEYRHLNLETFVGKVMRGDEVVRVYKEFEAPASRKPASNVVTEACKILASI